jgi:hypothetical protein
MELGGIVFVTHDVHPDAETAWRRWYDVEHLPEYVALPGVLGAQRYVATADLRALRGADPAPAFAEGRGAYLTVYQLAAGDLERTWGHLQEATASMAGAGRRFDPDMAPARHVELFRLDWALAADRIATSPGALPYVRHAGVQVAMGEVADPALRPVVADWYRDVHAPDVLAVEGFAAALRFVSCDHDGRHLVLFLLDTDPAVAVRAVRSEVGRWRELGRTPSPGGASRAIVNGPYRVLPPVGAGHGVTTTEE